jgi:hypothetical protein
MTKNMRIENADTSSHKVRLYVEDKNADGEWERREDAIPLDYPTAMKELAIFSTRRLVIEEG